ncbi:MAG: Csp1 family four helix bundle copper storage protein [Pseudomonadota bacterium]|nr:Csp1 family four helix bundle copper storage protein [Pseudomonadota bacterium]
MTNFEKPSSKNEKTENGVSRRDIILGMGAAAAFAYAGPTNAAMPGHDHSKHTAQQAEVLGAANACLDKGQRCIAHCLVSFTEGDTELAYCAMKVHEMQEICNAFSYLLASNSSYVKEYSSICEKVCKDCAKECRKHEKHIECKACAEACDDIVAAIQLHLA